jgi:hypothetical protein
MAAAYRQLEGASDVRSAFSPLETLEMTFCLLRTGPSRSL